jgi:steroid delta-isomerase-like uncharacterized protein
MTFLEEWFEEVWNKGREEAIDEMLLPDARTYGLHHPDESQAIGRQAFKSFYKQFRSSFVDIHIEVKQTVTEGNWTMARCEGTGTHTGDGLGWPATGKRVKFTGMCLVRLEDGRAAEAWNQFDFGTLYRQLQ